MIDYESDPDGVDREVESITGVEDDLPDPYEYRPDLDGAGPSGIGRRSPGLSSCSDTASRGCTPTTTSFSRPSSCTDSASRPGTPTTPAFSRSENRLPMSGRFTPSISGATRPGVLQRLSRAPSVEPGTQAEHNEMGTMPRWWNGQLVTEEHVEHWQPGAAPEDDIDKDAGGTTEESGSSTKRKRRKSKTVGDAIEPPEVDEEALAAMPGHFRCQANLICHWRIFVGSPKLTFWFQGG